MDLPQRKPALGRKDIEVLADYLSGLDPAPGD